MDNLTHSLFALTLANAGLRQAGRGTTAALLVASNIPDIEVLTAFTGGRVAYLAAHRGPTHGPSGLLLAVVVAGVVWAVARGRAGAEAGASFARLLAVSAAGVAGHIVMDLATSYGTRVLSPFTETWYGVDWVPIIDPVLLAILGAGLLAARLKPSSRARVAAAVLVLTVAFYAARATAHSAAMTRAVELARVVPAPAVPTSEPGTVFHYLGRERPAVLPAALPAGGSPFAWRVIVRGRDGYLVTEVNLRRRATGWQDQAVASGIWFPDHSGPQVDRAAAAELARVFLAFSRFPSAEVVPRANGSVTVHWYDLRFGTRRTPGRFDRRAHTSPFGAWVRLSPSGDVIGQGLGPG